MRSRAEVAVANHLDACGVEWRYEQPVDPSMTDGRQLRYLPDFFVVADPEGWLPGIAWVEVKPDDQLYALRDDMAYDAQLNGCDEVDDHMTAEEIQRFQIDELWKPKRLAELTGRNVLVAGTVNAQRRLSVEMRPTRVVLSKVQPFVNRRGEEMRREREEQQRYWAAERERMRLEYEAAHERMRAQRAAEEERARREVHELLVARIRSAPSKQAMYAGECRNCGQWADAHDLAVHNVNGRWFPMHWDCP